MTEDSSAKIAKGWEHELKAAGLEALRTESFNGTQFVECRSAAAGRRLVVERGPDDTVLSTDIEIRDPSDLPDPFGGEMDSFRALGLLTQLLPRGLQARFSLAGRGVHAIRLLTSVPNSESMKVELAQASKKLLEVADKIPADFRRLDKVRDQLSNEFGYARQEWGKSTGPGENAAASTLVEAAGE